MRLDETVEHASQRSQPSSARRPRRRRDAMEAIALERRWPPAVRFAMIAAVSLLVWAIIIAAAVVVWRVAV